MSGRDLRRTVERLAYLGGLFRSETSMGERAVLTRASAHGLVRFEPCPVHGWVATLTARGRAALAWHPQTFPATLTCDRYHS